MPSKQAQPTAKANASKSPKSSPASSTPNPKDFFQFLPPNVPDSWKEAMCMDGAFGEAPQKLCGVREDGIDVDLIDVTDRTYPRKNDYHAVKSSRMSVIHDSRIMAQMPTATREFLRSHGKAGIACSRIECGKVQCQEAPITLKRCGRCREVCYCSPECQRADWYRHKDFCKPAEDDSTKDSWIRYARYMLANAALRVMFKSYARSVLHLDTDRLAGMRSRLVVTCTAIPDRVRGTGRIFQVARVHFEPTLEDFVGLLPLIERHNGQFIGIQIMFKFDVPGFNGAYHALETIPPATFNLVPAIPVPVAILAQLNQTIRDDVDNNFKLRMP